MSSFSYLLAPADCSEHHDNETMPGPCTDSPLTNRLSFWGTMKESDCNACKTANIHMMNLRFDVEYYRLDPRMDVRTSGDQTLIVPVLVDPVLVNGLLGGVLLRPYAIKTGHVQDNKANIGRYNDGDRNYLFSSCQQVYSTKGLEVRAIFSLGSFQHHGDDVVAERLLVVASYLLQ